MKKAGETHKDTRANLCLVVLRQAYIVFCYLFNA